MRRTGRRTLMMVAMICMLTVPQHVVAQRPSTLAEFSWLQGAWVMQDGDDRLDEWWSSPVGNSMVGSFRWTRDGRLWMTEHMSITDEGADVIFRLRHFSAEMAAWEERGDPFVYRLTERDGRRATFAIMEQKPGRPLRFVFESLQADSLLVRIVGEDGGRPTVQEFRFRRGGSHQESGHPPNMRSSISG